MEDIEFVYTQVGERYISICAQSLEEAQEKLEEMSSKEVSDASVFKCRDSYWM